MSIQATTAGEITFDQVYDLAQRLQPIDQARLVAQLGPQVKRLLDQQAEPVMSAHQPLRGLLADLGPAPSAEDIDEVQHEMWATFAQE